MTAWGKLIATTGSLANTVGANQPFRYRGYVYDTETGWYYLQSRYYDPETCRFISADVLLSTGQGVIGHNSFAYCLNMPTNGADSHGHVFRPYSVQMTDSGSGNAAYYATVLVNRYKGKSKASLTSKIKNKSFFGAQARSVNSDKKSQLSLKSLNPIYYETGERSVTTISSSGFSDSPVSVYAENRLDNVLTSSVGINVNINSATFNVNLGADNIGMYSMHHDGSSTSYVGIVVDCSSLRAGLECEVIESICDVETTYYNSIGINGLGAFAFAFIAYEICSTGTSPTLELLCSELYAY